MLKVKILFFVSTLFIGFGASASELRAALLGDSMTWIGGQNCENSRGWTHYIKELADIKKVDVYARSGATWTNTTETRVNPIAYSEVLDNDNVLYNQAVRLINAAKLDPERVPDVIVLYAGANDAWFAKRRPGIFNACAGVDVHARPCTVTSLAGSIELTCLMLKEAFPSAHMVLIAPIEMAQAPRERTGQIADIIEDTGKKLGIRTLRADRESGIKRDSELGKNKTYTTDGVHTNERGAVTLATYICSKIHS